MIVRPPAQCFVCRSAATVHIVSVLQPPRPFSCLKSLFTGCPNKNNFVRNRLRVFLQQASKLHLSSFRGFPRMAGLQVSSGSLLKAKTSDEGQEDHYAGVRNAAAPARCVLPFILNRRCISSAIGRFGRPQKTDVQLESKIQSLCGQHVSREGWRLNQTGVCTFIHTATCGSRAQSCADTQKTSSSLVALNKLIKRSGS